MDFEYLKNDELAQVVDAVVSAGLDRKRALLVGGIDRQYVASLPEIPTPRDQVASDARAMNSLEVLLDGTVPLAIYLRNAAGSTRSPREHQIFERALSKVRPQAPKRAGRVVVVVYESAQDNWAQWIKALLGETHRVRLTCGSPADAETPTEPGGPILLLSNGGDGRFERGALKGPLVRVGSPVILVEVERGSGLRSVFQDVQHTFCSLANLEEEAAARGCLLEALTWAERAQDGRSSGPDIKIFPGRRPRARRALPVSPYPMLRPAAHPHQLGGRAADLDALEAFLRHRPLAAIFAPSGYGKSSLLQAGLVPRLRARTPPVPVTRHCDPTSQRLAADLLEGLTGRARGSDRAAREPADFARQVRAVRESAKQAPWILLDQLEEIFKTPDPIVRTRVALLLAATAKPHGDAAGADVRWVLCYREEFHGDVSRWLQDLFREDAARAEPSLPADLLPRADWAWPVPAVGRDDPMGCFADAIRRPLTPYPAGTWHIHESDVNRLAGAFARTRRTDPAAPLVPELQVVLGRMVRDAQGGRLQVPDDIERQITDALHRHLVEVLNEVFARGSDATQRRTLAALALRRLADTHSRANRGLTWRELATTVDDATLHQLAGSEARLIVVYRQQGQTRVRLSHDRLAVVLNGIDNAELFGPRTGFDAPLIQLALRVGQRASQFKQTGECSSIGLSPKERARIAEQAPRLLWDKPRRDWWSGVQADVRRRDDARNRQLVEDAARLFRGDDDPDTRLEALTSMLEGDAGEQVDSLIDESKPWETLLGAPDSRDVERARERLILRLLPSARRAEQFGQLAAAADIARHPDTPGRVSAEVHRSLRQRIHGAIRKCFPAASQSHFVRHSDTPGRVSAEVHRSLRQRIHDAIRKCFPASSQSQLVRHEGFDGDLPDPTTGTFVWVEVPGGTFQMGSNDLAQSKPVHEVALSPFQLLRHPVTRAQYRAFDIKGLTERDPADARPGADHVPVAVVSWYECQAFAIWLDAMARLPTEAEWEYAARGGPKDTRYTHYWSGDEERDLARVGWYDKNAGGHRHGVCEKANKARHPLDLCDVHGNVWEWTADLYVERYPDTGLRQDPAMLRCGSSRVLRGGSFLHPAVNARSANRNRNPPGVRNPFVGFRVLRPAPELGNGS